MTDANLPNVALEMLWRAVTDGTTDDYTEYMRDIFARMPNEGMSRDEMGADLREAIVESILVMACEVPRLLASRLEASFARIGYTPEEANRMLGDLIEKRARKRPPFDR